MKYRPDQKERMITLARALYTETSMQVNRIGFEVGISKDYIWKWAKEHGWVRPPKTFAPREPISVKQYRERFMAEIGVPPPAVATREPPPSRVFHDSFDMTERAANEDAKQKRHDEALATRAKIMKLWNDGLEVSIIARRVRWTPTRVRNNLKAWGADLKAPRYVGPKFNMRAAASVSRTRRSNKGMAAVHWRRT